MGCSKHHRHHVIGTPARLGPSGSQFRPGPRTASERRSSTAQRSHAAHRPPGSHAHTRIRSCVGATAEPCGPRPLAHNTPRAIPSAVLGVGFVCWRGGTGADDASASAADFGRFSREMNQDAPWSATSTVRDGPCQRVASSRQCCCPDLLPRHSEPAAAQRRSGAAVR